MTLLNILKRVISKISNTAISNLAIPLNCQWTAWSITDCSATCGEGTRTKTRSIGVKEANGGKCYGKSTEKEPCNLKKCIGKYLIFCSC